MEVNNDRYAIELKKIETAKFLIEDGIKYAIVSIEHNNIHHNVPPTYIKFKNPDGQSYVAFLNRDGRLSDLTKEIFDLSEISV